MSQWMDFLKYCDKEKIIFCENHRGQLAISFPSGSTRIGRALNQKMEKWNLNRAIHNPHAKSYKLARGSAIDWFENVMACADDSSIMSLSVNDKPELLATRYIGELLLFLFFLLFQPLINNARIRSDSNDTKEIISRYRFCQNDIKKEKLSFENIYKKLLKIFIKEKGIIPRYWNKILRIIEKKERE